MRCTRAVVVWSVASALGAALTVASGLSTQGVVSMFVRITPVGNRVDAVTMASNELGTIDVILTRESVADSVDTLYIEYGDSTAGRAVRGRLLKFAPDSNTFTHWYVRTPETEPETICTTRITLVTRQGVRIDTAIAVRVTMADESSVLRRSSHGRAAPHAVRALRIGGSRVVAQEGTKVNLLDGRVPAQTVR